MLYLVEGLNGSGKTTYITNKINEDQDNLPFNTYWINPLRWHEDKVGIIDRDKYSDDSILSYQIGAYESIWKMMPFIFNDKQIYWDRTWISAFAYGSLDSVCFRYLASLYKSDSVKIVFMDTDLDDCLERFKNRIEHTAKDYVEHISSESDMVDFWKYVLQKFGEAFIYLENMGYKIERVKNENNIT